MPRLTVKIVCTEPSTELEVVLAQSNHADYSPIGLDAVINEVLDKAQSTLKVSDESLLRPWRPEISVSLSGDDVEKTRPAFHLGAIVIARLARAEATFDFDPYV